MDPAAMPWAEALGPARSAFGRVEDPELGPAFALLETAFWEDHFASRLGERFDVAIRSVRYKPGHSLRVALTLGPADRPIPIAAEATRDPTDAARAAGKASRKRLVAAGPLPPFGLLLSGRAFFHLAWNDPQLPGLTVLLRPERFARALEDAIVGGEERVRAHRLEVVPVKYRPERGALLRLVLRTRRHVDGSRIRRRLAAKAQATPLRPDHARWEESAARRCPLLPRPFGSLPEGRLRLWEWRAGEPVEAAIELDDGRAEEAVERAGFALRLFHQTVPPPRRAPGESWEPLVASLRRTAPDLADRAARLVRALERAERGLHEQRAVHGDFHARQVLTGEGTLSVLDLDRARAADPHLDLGTFLARLPPDAASLRDAFLEGYGSHEPGRLVRAVARAHLRLAPQPLRNLLPDWRARVLAHLEAAERLLDEA